MSRVGEEQHHRGSAVRDPELRWLIRSFQAHPSDGGATLTELARRVTSRARQVGETEAPLRVFREQLGRGGSDEIRSKLLLEVASLHGYREELQERAQTLREAAQAAQARRDDRGHCDAIIQLSLPIDDHVPFPERRGLAERGFELARRVGDPRLVAFGAAAVSIMARSLGESPSPELRRHIEAYSHASRTPEEVSSSMCYWEDWATQALVGGDHQEVWDALAQVTRFASSVASADLPGVRPILLWRLGRWDEAMSLSDRALERPLQLADRALIVAVRVAIQLERVARVEAGELLSHEHVFDPVDVAGSAVMHSVLTDLRAATRASDPARDALGIVESYVRVGIRAGWEDVLLAIAKADAVAYRRIRPDLEGSLPTGERADAIVAIADAIGLTREDRPESRDVEAAGETLLARDEGFVAARAFQEAARIRAETGFRVGELRRRAARIYRDLQADRALATLLRTTNWPRDLAEFRVPASQFKQRSAGLTAREAEVAELASRGYTTREIAGMLSISPATSETHIRNLKRKLGISRKSELVRLREVNE